MTMIRCKPINAPIDPTHKLATKEGSVHVEKGGYQRLVERMIYLSYT